MNHHLTDEEITEGMLGANALQQQKVADHLPACATCSAEIHELHYLLASFRDTVVTAGERDASFWARQRMGVEERLHPTKHSPLRWAANALALLVLLGAFLLLRAPRPVPRATNDVNDDLLLEQVQSDLERDYPVALAPAALITNERTRALSNDSAPPPAFNHKEQQR
jgi:hypothetical protein